MESQKLERELQAEVKQVVLSYQFRASSKSGFYVNMQSIPEQVVILLKFDEGAANGLRQEIAYNVVDFFVKIFASQNLLGKNPVNVQVNEGQIKPISWNPVMTNCTTFIDGLSSDTYGYFDKSLSRLVVFLNRKLGTDERERIIMLISAALERNDAVCVNACGY